MEKSQEEREQRRFFLSSTKKFPLDNRPLRRDDFKVAPKNGSKVGEKSYIRPYVEKKRRTPDFDAVGLELKKFAAAK